MSSEKGIMTLKERHEQVEGYLGKTVTIEIDRPIGYVHHKGEKSLVYPINYGFIPGVLGGDGEVYEGEFINGKLSGYGKATLSSGNTLEGEWENGRFVK